MVVVTKGGIKARDRLKAQFETYLRKTFPGTDTYVKLLEVGPPVGRPVQYRVSGPDLAKVRDLAQKLAGIVRSNPDLGNVVFDWMEPARVVKVDVLQDKARQLGVTSEDIATTLNWCSRAPRSHRFATASISSMSRDAPPRQSAPRSTRCAICN